MKSLRLSLAESRVTLARFFRWWEAELRSAYEDWTRLAWRTGRGEISVSAEEVILSRTTSGSSQIRTHRPWAGRVEDLPALVGDLLREQIQAPRWLDVVLPHNAVLSRRLHLPAAAGTGVREALGYQLERLMPFKREFVYFDGSAVSAEPVTRRLLVELTVARKALVDQIVGIAVEQGVRSVSVHAPRPADGLGGATFVRRAGARTSALRPLDRWLAYSAAALAFAAASVSLVEFHIDGRRLEAQVQALRTRATTADGLRQTMDSQMGRIHFLTSQARIPSQAAVLAELTRLLPEDTWIFQFQCEGVALQISGYAKNASSLSTALAKSALFADVALRSANKAPGSDTERFDIAIHLRAPAA